MEMSAAALAIPLIGALAPPLISELGKVIRGNRGGRRRMIGNKGIAAPFGGKIRRNKMRKGKGLRDILRKLRTEVAPRVIPAIRMAHHLYKTNPHLNKFVNNLADQGLKKIHKVLSGQGKKRHHKMRKLHIPKRMALKGGNFVIPGPLP